MIRTIVISLFATSAIAKSINSEFLDEVQAKSLLSRSKRGITRFTRDESEECFTEDTRCTFEDFAEKAENEFGTKPFGPKSWLKVRTPDVISVKFFEENYTNCDSTELNYGCKRRINHYLKCAGTGADRANCAEENKKIEPVEAAKVDTTDKRKGRSRAEGPTSKSNKSGWRVNNEFVTRGPEWLNYKTDY